MMSCPYFWDGVVVGIIATLVLGALALAVLFRAFNDNNWEGSRKQARLRKRYPDEEGEHRDGGP
jgi:hypothetical protein